MDIVQDNPVDTIFSIDVLPEILTWLKHDSDSDRCFLSEEDRKMIDLRLQQRSDFGKEKYGSFLRTFNGRDCEIDAQQEIIDCIQYLFQMRLENRSLSTETIKMLQTLFRLTNEMVEKK